MVPMLTQFGQQIHEARENRVAVELLFETGSVLVA